MIRKQLVTVAGALVFAWLAGADAFVHQVLTTIWPVAAGALALALLAGAVALAIYLIGSAVLAVRPPAPAVEVFTPPALTTYARDVAAVFDEDDEAIHAERWRLALTQFAMVGSQVGFGIRALSPYIGRRRRQVYVDLLTGARVIVSDNESTRWAPGWNYRGLRAALQHRVVEPPYPNSDPPALSMTGRAGANQTYSPSEVVLPSSPYRSRQ